MYRTKDYGGMAMAHLVLLLIAFGQYMANRVYIFYWHKEKYVEDQIIRGIPLTGKGVIYLIVFNTFCLLAYVSFLRAACSNPGKIEPGTTAPFKSKYDTMKVCEKTGMGTWKPTRAHFCSQCGFCVFKMDHHCPWINNCVGHRNMKYFL